MFIVEVLGHTGINKVGDGFYDENADGSVLSISDNRKTRLTLQNIRRLRLMNIARQTEHEQKRALMAAQYGSSSEQSGSQNMF